MKKKLLPLLALAFCTASSWALDQANGVYQIGTAQDLVDFAALVNAGTTGANAVLTTNIDLDGTTWTPIGNSTNKYTGTFDGQGYAITNFDYTATSDYNGLFGYISNATVKNFSISGTLTSVGYNKNGVVGCATGTSKVTGIHSSMAINVSNSRAQTGGIVGGDNGATTDKIVVDGCEFSGTLTHSGTGDCQAGIMGYTGYSTIRNCIFSGTIIGENNKYGGILGYCKQPSFGGVQNCLSIGKIVADPSCTTAAAIIANFNGAATSNVKNNYYCLQEGSTTSIAIGNNASSCEAPHAVTAEQLASGEVCYLLNENVGGGTNWYQTLPADTKPTLDNTHGQVYVNGTVCPDTGTPQGTVSYSNSEGTTVGNHVPVYGFCTYCGTIDAEYLTANGEGFYEISNKEELVWFAALVNAGTYNAKAKLTADIDMDGADISHFPIGDASATSKYFIGTFDGQGHKLSNFQLVNTSAPTNYGMFNATTGVVLKNFWLDSSCEIHGKEMVGLIGHLYGGGTLEGIGNCANVTGIQNNIGGLIGGVTGNSSNKKNITIKNCWTRGKVKTTNPSASKGKDCGALTGWFNNAIISIEGFWTVADVANPTSADKYVYRNGAGASFTISNSFSKNGNQTYYTNFTDEQLENGWLCYGLNGDQSDIAWYQTIRTDATPVLDSDSEEVLYVGAAGYSTMYDAENDWELVGDAQAYIGTLSSSSSIHLDEISDIPAGTAVVISGTYYNKVSTTATSDTEGNILLGSDGTVSGGEGIYALAIKYEVVGFYPVSSSITIPEGRAYLNTNTNPVKGFFSFEEDDATAIKAIDNEQSTDNVIYNVAGQRLQKMQNGRSTAVKGIYIVNGKKVLF